MIRWFLLPKKKHTHTKWGTSTDWTDFEFGEIFQSTIEKCNHNILDQFTRRSSYNDQFVFEGNQSNCHISYGHIPTEAATMRYEDNANLWFNQNLSRFIWIQHLLQICGLCSWSSANDSKFPLKCCKNQLKPKTLVALIGLGLYRGLCFLVVKEHFCLFYCLFFQTMQLISIQLTELTQRKMKMCLFKMVALHK